LIMQHDEMIWTVINNQFCSHKTTLTKAKSDKRDFCRHPYSVTGLCNRTSCPLANSRYATIREENGRVTLYLKTVERAHSPKNLWEKIYLSRNYSKALAQVDHHLQFFPKTLIHRNKQRLTKIYQYLIRMRKIKLRERSGQKGKIVSINRKIDQREERREKKALVAAKIEANIEKELVERLAKGTYGDIYNFPEVPYQKMLEDGEDDEMEEESEEEESESEEEETGYVEYVENLDEEESSEEEVDMEDMEYENEGEQLESGLINDDQSDSSSSGEESEEEDSSSVKKTKIKTNNILKTDKFRDSKKRRGTRVEIEYEEEEENITSEVAVAGNAW